MSSSQKFDVEVDQSPSKNNSRPVQKFSPLRQVGQNPFYVHNKVTLDTQNAHKFDCNFGIWIKRPILGIEIDIFAPNIKR